MTITTALLWIVMQATAPAASGPATAPAVATTRPVAAVWFEASRPSKPDEEMRRLIVGVWGDGTVVWSDDRATGGKPYRTAHVDRQRVEKLLADLKNADFFAETRKVNFGPDASYTVLAGERAGERQWLGSWHEPARDNGGKSVVTEQGIVAVPPGEKPPEPSAEYRRYLGVWSRSRQLIEDIIPKEGRPLEAIDDRVFHLGRPPRGEKKQ